jgi:DNA-directed RNA polymerase II subunit RPB1
MPVSGFNQGFSIKDSHQVREVRFGLLSKEEIIGMSVAEINQTSMYDFKTWLPVKGGLNDPRMGTTSNRWLCLTCEGDTKECPGHFGHINLAKPVYHVGFMDTIKKILSCVCYHCSSLLIKDKNSIDF